MDDPDLKSSSKAKFKSKWSRVFKEKESHEIETQPQHTSSFKLDDDVADFLKPSTDRAASVSSRPAFPPAPKLDIAIAQRWPEAHEVRRASAATPSAKGGLETPNGYTKPKRRKGLRVGFVRTGPEVIGEGGDECEEATMEVGRRREGRKRSVSDARAMGGHVTTQAPLEMLQGPGARGSVGQGFVAPPLRRAHTDFSDPATPAGRMQASPPKLSRTPTGFGSQDSNDVEESSPEVERHVESTMPRIDTHFAWEDGASGSLGSASSMLRQPDSSTASPKDPTALAVRKRELRSSEGMTLRRASAMITEDDGSSEEAKRQSLGFGVQPPQQHYDTLSRPDAPDLMPEPRSALSPLSAKSPLGPSPFDDPKYAQRRSPDVTPNQAQRVPQPQAPSPQSLRQQRQPYQPSYMRAGQQQQQESSPSPPFQSRPPIPAVPQVQPPPESNYAHTSEPSSAVSPPAVPRVHNPADPGYDKRASYTYASEPPSAVSQPTRPPAAPSERMHPPQPQQQSRSRDPSPMPERNLGGNAAAQAPRPFYSRPNGSNGSLNHFPLPKQSHSRSSSRDGQSPHSDTAGGTSHPSPTRFQTYSQSPPGGSPRSSVVGRSPLSPYGAAVSTGQQQQPGYFGGQKAQQPHTLQPPQGHLQVDDPSSRPVSASSNRSFSRPLNSFSAPRQPQAQQGQMLSANVQQDEMRQASWTSTASHQPRPIDTIAAHQQQPQTWMPKSAASTVSRDSWQGPGSGPGSRPTSFIGGPHNARPAASPQSTSEGNPAADAAYADFAARVAHMKGVFRLTAEKQRPSDRCTPQTWLRAALWWYSRGKAGLEVLLQQQRPRSSDGQVRELLAQPHVDLAKTWWMLSDPLEPYDGPDDSSPQSATSTGGVEIMLRQSIATLRSHLKSLSLSMGRSQLMPPPQSLIQGQDTTIWLEYPTFGSGAATVLGGSIGLQALDALPMGDSKDVHYYNRFPVDVSMSTDDPATDRVVLPCMLTMLRGKRDFVTTVVIASQSELVSIKIAPRQGGDKGLTWHDVSWKASSCGMLIRLPHNYDLMVRMGEKDFRALWNLVEYARKVEHCFRPEEGERVVLEMPLAEMQYADSGNTNAFPSEKFKGAIAVVFERTVTSVQGGVERRLHRGYRLLLVADPKHKSLASTSHEVCRRGPLLFEFITDSAAGGMAAMVVRIREESRQCRILLVFPVGAARQEFYDVLNGLTVGPDEAIVAKMGLTAMNIEPAASSVTDGSMTHHPALQTLQWQKLGVTNALPDEDDSHHSPTIASDSLRVVARHTTGCITDRLNLSKGELSLRLTCTLNPSIQFLCAPQEDLTISIDTRHSPAHIVDGLSELHHTIRMQPTIRTLTFPSFEDLHAFQLAVTGCAVRFDGSAAVLSIARRRMMVPIYKKWEATNVRLQVVAKSGVVQVLAFMEGFSHAEALCFRVMSTDVFETTKVGKRAGVRLVDAKFALPLQDEHGKEKEKKDDKKDGDSVVEPESREAKEERVRRRFVNLEGLEYMSEHDDITVGFESVEERDRFAEALPTAATVGRGFTLKRRT